MKAARDEARMTQRELAAALDVKASHIAYIENGHRKPSMSLMNRLADTLGLSAKELLVLAHPEAQQIVDRDHKVGKKRDSVWGRFASSKALLKGHAISPAELKMLKQVSIA